MAELRFFSTESLDSLCPFPFFLVSGLPFIAIKKMECDGLVSSRGSEGEEFRAAEAGGKNGRRASARRELQDIAVRNRICLGYKEIARAVKGQAARKSYAGREGAPNAGLSEIDNRVGSRIGKRFDGNEQIAAAIKGKAHWICAGRERAWPDENSARSIRSEFIDRLCVAVCCIEIACAVESQAPVCLQIIARRSTGNGAEDDPLSARRELRWCRPMWDSYHPSRSHRHCPRCRWRGLRKTWRRYQRY